MIRAISRTGQTSMQITFNVNRDTVRTMKPLLDKVSVDILSEAFSHDQRLFVDKHWQQPMKPDWWDCRSTQWGGWCLFISVQVCLLYDVNSGFYGRTQQSHCNNGRKTDWDWRAELTICFIFSTVHLLWYTWFWSRPREFSVQKVDDFPFKNWKEKHLTYLVLFC